jgi:hypothetical protein
MVTGKCAKCGTRTVTSEICDVCARFIGEETHILTAKIKDDSTDGATTPPKQEVSSKSIRPAFLFNAATNEKHALNQSVSKIGRDQTNNIAIRADHYISRHHAWILQMHGNYWVEDLGSTNGTLLNGEPLTDRRQIAQSDRITFGKTEFVFSLE